MAAFETTTEPISPNGGAAANAAPWSPVSPGSRPPYTRVRLSTMEDARVVDAVLADAFGLEGIVDSPPELLVFEPERMVVFALDGEPVGNAGALSRSLAIPGGVIRAAHLVQGGVRQTHRRHGLMTRIMTTLLREGRDVHGEAVAVWWASEARIYHRYGVGLASRNQTLAIDKREIELNNPPEMGGRLIEAAPPHLAPQLRDIYDAVYPSRPGWSSRVDAEWNRRLLDPPPEFRDGLSSKRAVVYETADGPAGYAIWQRRQEWTGAVANGEVHVFELAARTPEAYAAVWNFLLSVDLTRTVHWAFASIDEPLQFMVNEPRALGTSTTDGLWVRLLDLPVALAARRYSAPLDVVIDVADALFPENAGRWRLTVDGGIATCTATTDDADLACDASVLGAAYLGGSSLGALGAAGRVRELTAGALAATNAAFSWAVAPSSLSIF